MEAIISHGKSNQRQDCDDDVSQNKLHSCTRTQCSMINVHLNVSSFYIPCSLLHWPLAEKMSTPVAFSREIFDATFGVEKSNYFMDQCNMWE